MGVKKMSKAKPFSKKNLGNVPDQSGIYELLNRNGKVNYVGRAGAGRLQERLREHLNLDDIPGSSQFRFRPTSSTDEAKKLEKKYIKIKNPKHNTLKP